MTEQELRDLAKENGLSVEKIRGGFTIDTECTLHGMHSAVLTDYGLSSTSETDMHLWLAETSRVCLAQPISLKQQLAGS